MNQNYTYSIKSTIEFEFKNPETCEIGYNSFLPELGRKKTHRSIISMKKVDKSLIFQIESLDITAFRASISDIIDFGKIIENLLNYFNSK